MRLGSRLRPIGFFVTLLAVCGWGGAAEAADADKQVCADSYKSAQLQRKSGALKRARESLLVCLSDKCPSVMEPDCTRWLTEVEAALPSVAFAAKGVDGKDVTAVRVLWDGQVLTDTLDGKSIAVDPGTHSVRFEHAGEPPIEQTISVREGEKARVVSVSWAKPQEHGVAASDSSTKSGPPVSAWVVGGIGAASLATFGVLALHGMSRRSDLKEECFGTCRQEQVDSIKTELTIADVALGVGIVSLGVSALLFLTSSGGSSARSTGARSTPRIMQDLSFGVAPRTNGGAASFSARF
jgi:hypothetical protein